MRAHGKGSEGSEKRGGGAKIKRGCEKKGGAPHPPFFKKGGARSTGTPPVYAPELDSKWNKIDFRVTIEQKSSLSPPYLSTI